MDSILAGFVRALRAAGAEASPAEAIDAARTVALLGYADRANLKSALGVVLAKSEEDKQIHDRLFDLYFSAPAAAPQAGADRGQVAGRTPGRTGDTAVDALIALATPQAGGQASDALRSALARAAAQAGVDDIRFATQAPYLTSQTLAALGIAPLEARIAQRMAEPGSAADAEVHRLTQARDALRQHARALVQQRFELFGKPATEAFMTEVAVNRPIGRMAPAEMERMKAAVARMARKLAQQHARRQKVVLHGRLDLRRSMRANAGHDDVPFKLVWKQRRRDRPRIVAVCDVSGSVATHVRFLLLFLYALHDSVGDLRSFAFSSRLKDVTAPLEHLPFDDAMALILKEVGSGATDYGQAWQDLHDRHWDAIDRRTTVIVLGDGRSNGADPRLDLFAELAGRAKRVVWLSPEPPGRWGTGDSALLRYRPLCTRLSHAASAQDLERALDEALAAYH
ncbi:VWA domain-containing protein [Xenophilus sp. Marseille-Q4582]|uniref:vWA domain-containing protein n=1 Tax=Xenophilus sp. Marseille-Q4582 TaxID=2866600 RepID=UPI001CE41726|nr:VWA domain-containing protein [Xenophilus sp. Marseille-Q4582]